MMVVVADTGGTSSCHGMCIDLNLICMSRNDDCNLVSPTSIAAYPLLIVVDIMTHQKKPHLF